MSDGMEIIIFIGIQASGKSEFYKQKFYKTHVRINLDMLKTRNREKILVEACLKVKQPFVVDNTNPRLEDRKRYIDMVKEDECKIIGYYFESSIAKSLKRNKNREGREKLPDLAIQSTHSKLQLPSLEEGFHELYYVKIHEENYSFIVEEYRNEV